MSEAAPQKAQASGCPFSGSAAAEPVSLLSPRAMSCPYGVYKQLRSEEPVKYLPDQNIWIVTRYDDVEYVLENPERFSAKESPSSTNAYRAFPEALAILAQSRAVPRARTLMLADLPHHTRYRTTAQRALAPARTLKEFSPKLRTIVDELIDGFCESGRAEIVGALSIPLPMALVAHIFQVSPDWISKLKGWSDSFFAALSGSVGEKEVIKAAHDTLEFENFILDRIAERRQTPVDDFLGRLIAQPEGEEKLTDPEIVNICSQILVGGNESSINMLSNLIYLIATTEGLQQKLQADPARIPALVEESLRMEPPLQAMYRITRHEEDFNGVKVPPNSKLMLNFGSANRDETYYQDGESFDLDRDNRETIHLAFGRGIHACAGQALARKEAVFTIEKVIARLPNLRLSTDLPPERAPLFGVRGFRTLNVEFDPTPRMAPAVNQ